MYSIEKKSINRSLFGRYLPMLLILGSVVICIEACSKDPEEPKNDPSPKTNPPGEGNQGGGQAPADSLDADVVSQYLKLVNATKITGQPPEGVDGLIYNDVKDSIFLVRGLPVGDRISFLHDPAINVTGFYVYVPGASYYYDVPSLPEDGRDSTDVVYVDAEFPVADFKDYPISFPIHLMPYVDNIPFKTFIEIVKIEDAKDPDVCNSILRERAGGVDENRVWQWEFTIRQYKGDILDFWAPGITTGVNKILGGCCLDGVKSLNATEIGCHKIDSLRSPRQTWVEFPVYDGRTNIYEWMNIWDDGTIDVYGELDEAAIVPDTRNFCTQTVDLAFNLYGREHIGNHDFTPGDNTVNLTFPPSPVPTVSFLGQESYDLVYTCNSLVLSRGNKTEGEEWGFVYKRIDIAEFDDFEGEIKWYDNLNNPFYIN